MTTVAETDTVEAPADVPAHQMKYLGRAGLFALPLAREMVRLPGAGVQLVRELTAGEVGEVNNLAVKREGDKIITDYRNYRERCLAFALLEQDGSQMFSNPMQDYAKLRDLPNRVKELLYDAVDRLSGLTKKQQDALGKDSPVTTASDSTSS